MIRIAKSNPDVIEADLSAEDDSWVKRLARLRIFGKSPMGAFMELNRKIWNKLPTSSTALSPMRSYGAFLHSLARIQSVRGQLFHTFFLRNRSALELIRRLVERNTSTDPMRVAVLGCSTGPEAYSVAWTIRSARPDLRLILCAADISREALEIAENGVYSLATSQFAGSNMFDDVTQAEMEEMFDKKGETIAVRSWIKEGMKWYLGDVRQLEFLSALGPQDIVVANNFLCHMSASVAEQCLRNIARLVTPHGYLFVSGIDLNIRTKVAKELGWVPVQELLEEIHEGDPRMRSNWPFHYAGLEPLNKRRGDWRFRYAAAFQVGLITEKPERRGLAKRNASGRRL